MCKRFGLNPGCLDTVIDELFRMGHIKREKPVGGGPYVYFRGSGGTPHLQPDTVVSAPAAGGDTDSEGGETDISRNETGNAYLTPEMQYLAPEDYELPDPDPALLASANRMLSERLAGVAHVLRGSGLPGLAEIDDGEDLQPHVAALAGAYQMACAEPEMLRQELAKADDELTEAAEAIARILWGGSYIDTADMELGELIAEAGNQMNDLRQQLEALMRGRAYAANAAGYVMIASKRKPRRTMGAEKAIAAATSAVKGGAQRADVFALLPVGKAVKGAEWKPL